jgi:hypothetical protein
MKPVVVCVVAISPTRGSEVRTYCRRLRGLLPEAKLLVLRPHLADADVSRATARMKEAGADFVVTSVAEATDVIASLQGKTGSTPSTRGAAVEDSGQLVAAAR